MCVDGRLLIDRIEDTFLLEANAVLTALFILIV